MEPVWEHGYRCHGYWLGDRQIGRVSIGPRGWWKPSDGYSWCLQSDSLQHPPVRKPCMTLAAAKRAVEREYFKAVEQSREGM